MAVKIVPGLRVAICKRALPALGRASWRGTVVEIADGWLATVKWEHGETTTMRVDNLAGVKSLAFIE